jgi:hypothetical protein
LPTAPSTKPSTHSLTLLPSRTTVRPDAAMAASSRSAVYLGEGAGVGTGAGSLSPSMTRGSRSGSWRGSKVGSTRGSRNGPTVSVGSDVGAELGVAAGVARGVGEEGGVVSPTGDVARAQSRRTARRSGPCGDARSMRVTLSSPAPNARRPSDTSSPGVTTRAPPIACGSTVSVLSLPIPPPRTVSVRAAGRDVDRVAGLPGSGQAARWLDDLLDLGTEPIGPAAQPRGHEARVDHRNRDQGQGTHAEASRKESWPWARPGSFRVTGDVRG